MSDYLGRLRREGDTLVAEVKPHDYEAPPRGRKGDIRRLVADPFCVRCGYHRLAAADGLAVHPAETDA